MISFYLKQRHGQKVSTALLYTIYKSNEKSNLYYLYEFRKEGGVRHESL